MVTLSDLVRFPCLRRILPAGSGPGSSAESAGQGIENGAVPADHFAGSLILLAHLLLDFLLGPPGIELISHGVFVQAGLHEITGLADIGAGTRFYLYGGMYQIFCGDRSESIIVNFYAPDGTLIDTADSAQMK